jgi:hypothetical protein
MYQALNRPHTWSEGYYFFTFANKQACSEFKQAVGAGLGRFLLEPVWGDADGNRSRYTPDASVTWGYTVYAFLARAGAHGEIRGNWVENPIPGGSRYYLRIYVPGLDEHDPYWKQLASRYKAS